MKKSYFGGLVLLFAMCLGTVAQAGVITDDIYVGKFLNEGESWTVTHNLYDQGVPDQYTVTSGSLSLGFSDGYKYGDLAWDLAGLSGSGLSGEFYVDGTHKYGYDIKSFGIGADGIEDLNADGYLSVTVTALETHWLTGHNDFWWKTSELVAYVKPAEVPEPATLALLGLGLAGLGVCRRKAKA